MKRRSSAHAGGLFGHQVQDVGARTAVRDVDLEIAHRGPREYATIHDCPVLSNPCHDHAPVTLFAEGERLRIPGIGVTVTIPGLVVVAEEGVVEPGPLDFRCLERGVKGLALALLAEPPSFGGMKERQVDPFSAHAEVPEEVVGSRGLVVVMPSASSTGVSLGSRKM